MAAWSRTCLACSTAFLVVCFIGCGGGSQPGIGSNRPLRVGLNNSLPYCSVGSDGIPRGFSVEVIREAARRKGIQLQVTAFREGPDRLLTQGKVDIWPLVTVLPERRPNIFFTDPWMRTKYVLITLHGSAIRDASGLAGRRISHEGSSLSGRLAKKAFPGSPLVAGPSGIELAAVCRGDAEAALIETKAMLARLLQRPEPCGSMNFDLVPLPGAAYEMAIGASPSGIEQAKVLRAAINDMAQDGTLDRLYGKWLHDTGDETAVVNQLIAVRRRDNLLRWASGWLTALWDFSWV